MSYPVRQFANLEGINRLDKTLVDMHLKLYEGYVKQVNELEEKGDPWRYAWEHNGMRLHELFFEQLTNAIVMPAPKVIDQEQIKALVKTRGPGWVCVFAMKQDKLQYSWIREHDQGLLACGDPILVLDMWEHAYLTQFGLDKDKYVNTILESIDWDVILNRMHQTKTLSWRAGLR